MSKFWIIALNVYKKQVRSAAFLIMVFAPLVIGALYYGMGKFMSDASSIDKIGVYDQQMVLANALSQSKEFEFQAMKSEKSGEKQLAEDIIKVVTPIRERIQDIMNDEAYLSRVVKQGAEKARESSRATLAEVRRIMGIKPF